MTNDDPRRKSAGDSPASGPAEGDAAKHAPPNQRRDPVFTQFDEDEDYEESERDTDYASAYEDEESEDDDYRETLSEERTDDDGEEWQVLEAAPNRGPRGGDRNPWDVPASGYDVGEDEDDLATDELDAESGRFEDEDLADDEDWEDTDDYPEDEEEQSLETGPREQAQQWPWGLVVVGVVALGLLAAGGYGVIQQRSAAQEEIRQLQATLATAGNPAEVAAGREALREMEERITRSQATIDALALENRRLTDTVAGLEQQLATPPATATVVPTAEPAPAAETPKSAPVPATSPAQAAAPGDWFVNFSSYEQRSTAESWVKKLKPSAGKAVVVEGSRDGRTFYRVRVVGLTDRIQAETVSVQLQSAHGLPPLWIGRE